MARKPKVLDAAAEARLLALVRAGKTAEVIAADLSSRGAKISRATIGRRIRDLAGRVQGERAAAFASTDASPSIPDCPEKIPEGTDAATFKQWIDTTERMKAVAEVNGDMDGLARAGRLATMLLEAKRKATPPAKQDPNELPDMVKLGAEVAERMHAIIRQIT